MNECSVDGDDMVLMMKFHTQIAFRRLHALQTFNLGCVLSHGIDVLPSPLS